MKLALGPVVYFWKRRDIFDFYRVVAGWPVDIVYLGEIICSKRRELRRDDWLAIAADLAAAGKEVVLSTLTLVEAESELSYMRRLVENGRFLIEANDMAALHMAARRVPFVAGPHINTYNAATLALLHRLGATRWVMPLELNREALAQLQATRPAGMQTEVFVFGRMPLSFSARCFTARAHNVGKDQCGFRCLDYPEGMPLATQDGKGLLSLNGIQTLSAETYYLLDALADIERLAVDVVRLSPQAQGMADVVGAFRAAMAGSADIGAVRDQLAAHIPQGVCNGYWHGRAGMEWVT